MLKAGVAGLVLAFGLAGAGAGLAQQPAAKAAPQKVNDAQIAAIVVVANSIDAELGELAAQRATRQDVKEFGKSMAAGHRALIESATQLVTRLKVTPAENDVSRQLRADAEKFKAELLKKKGAEFDKAYMAHEVEYHQAVIDAVDNLLVPNASNAELKQTLIGVRPAFVGHLQQAQQLLKQLQ